MSSIKIDDEEANDRIKDVFIHLLFIHTGKGNLIMPEFVQPFAKLYRIAVIFFFFNNIDHGFPNYVPQ